MSNNGVSLIDSQPIAPIEMRNPMRRNQSPVDPVKELGGPGNIQGAGDLKVELTHDITNLIPHVGFGGWRIWKIKVFAYMLMVLRDDPQRMERRGKLPQSTNAKPKIRSPIPKWSNSQQCGQFGRMQMTKGANLRRAGCNQTRWGQKSPKKALGFKTLIAQWVASATARTSNQLAGPTMKCSLQRAIGINQLIIDSPKFFKLVEFIQIKTKLIQFTIFPLTRIGQNVSNRGGFQQSRERLKTKSRKQWINQNAPPPTTFARPNGFQMHLSINQGISSNSAPILKKFNHFGVFLSSNHAFQKNTMGPKIVSCTKNCNEGGRSVVFHPFGIT